MDKNKKALTDLKKEHDDVLTALEMLYGECGEAQFEYAAHNAGSIAYRDTNDFGGHYVKAVLQRLILF